MPDYAIGEEAQNRNRSLCLFGTPGITSTSNRRCENCPGAARTPLIHQRRCPLDDPNVNNVFAQAAAAQAGKSDGPKSLASSSICNAVGATRSGDEHRSASGVLDSSPAIDRSVSDPHAGRKRKADDWPESSSRNEDNNLQREFSRTQPKPKSLSIAHEDVQAENERIRLSVLSIVHEDVQPDNETIRLSVLSIAHEDVQPDNETIRLSVLSIAHEDVQPDNETIRLSVLSIAHEDVQPDNETIRLSGDQFDGRSDVLNSPRTDNDWTMLSDDQLDGQSDVLDSPHNTEVVVFRDLPLEEVPVRLEHNIIDTSTDALNCFWSLVEAAEIEGPSDEELRNE